jgi:hypothetical protein
MQAKAAKAGGKLREWFQPQMRHLGQMGFGIGA